MKKLEAIVRKERFEEVIAVLEKAGVGGVTVTEAVGFGHHRNGLKPKMKIDIYVDEFQVEKTIDLIRRVAKTGLTGDGKNDAVQCPGILGNSARLPRDLRFWSRS